MKKILIVKANYYNLISKKLSQESINLLRNKTKVSVMSDSLHYKPKPGTLIFFPAYVPHEFAVDSGVDDFRFIHFNLQAVRNEIVNTAKRMK